MKKSFLSILALGLIATTTLFLVRSIAPDLEITSKVVETAPSKGTPGDNETTTGLAPTNGTRPTQGQRVEEMVSPTEDSTAEEEAPDGTGATFTEASSIGERLKQLPETTVLESSIVKDEYGDELLQRRSYLLETSLKYPYVEVIEWGQFDE